MTTPVLTNDIVFVYGALRSGTTVFRLMLDAHPNIANPGEMDFLFDFLHMDPDHPTGWRYDCEALALNRIFQSTGLTLVEGQSGLDLLQSFFDTLRQRHPGQSLSINIHRHIDRLLAILPDARLIHVLRDPRDVARSSIIMGWAGSLYHGVAHWIETETEWDAALAQPHRTEVMTLRYEDLFTTNECRLREVCRFFGRPFDPKMLRYHETTTYDAPDPSLIAQWRHKSNPHDIALLENRAGSLMTARGYPPEQSSTSPDAVTLAKLNITNKMHVWTFGVRRFGLVTYFGEKVTRKLRMTRLHRHFRQRMNVIVIQYLK